MSTVVLYCWCHSDGASVISYFTFLLTQNLFLNPFKVRKWHRLSDNSFDSQVLAIYCTCIFKIE